jgi:hypothetical protein
MFRILGHNAFEQRSCFGRALPTQEALTQMRARVEVLRLAFEGGAVAGFCFFKSALLEVYVAVL